MIDHSPPPSVSRRRIRAMASRWGYTVDELALALDDASRNPESFALWLDWDELVFGAGSEPIKPWTP